jgi:hypothetical protein
MMSTYVGRELGNTGFVCNVEGRFTCVYGGCSAVSANVFVSRVVNLIAVLTGKLCSDGLQYDRKLL